jgi:inhibitor of the pro-sigma K processing machinery
MVIDTIFLGILLAVIIAVGLIILFKAAGIIIKVLLHVLFGLILLVIVDLVPFVHIPINILTVLVAGFGGFIGVVFLIILAFVGLI